MRIQTLVGAADFCDDRAFAAGASFHRCGDKFETRSEQVSMSVEVRNALVTSSHRELEAGTGIINNHYSLPGGTFAQKTTLP